MLTQSTFRRVMWTWVSECRFRFLFFLESRLSVALTTRDVDVSGCDSPGNVINLSACSLTQAFVQLHVKTGIVQSSERRGVSDPPVDPQGKDCPIVEKYTALHW